MSRFDETNEFDEFGDLNDLVDLGNSNGSNGSNKRESSLNERNLPNNNSEVVQLLKQQQEMNKQMLETMKQISQNSTKVDTSQDYTLDMDEVRDYKGRLLSQESLRDIQVSIYEKDISFSGSNIPMAQDIYYAQKLGLKLRNIQAELKGGQLVFDGDKFRSSSGALKFNRIRLGLSDIVKGFIRKGSSESFFLPSITGQGSLQLKDTVKYLYMVKCVDVRKFILEQGVYCASAGMFEFGVHADTKLGSVILSNKNILQTTVKGRGILILELPVPPNELVILRVTPDRPVRVNEQEVIYREGNVKRNKRLASTVFGSMASGAGFVEEYTGDGLVVLAPSLNFADIISNDLGKEIEENIEKYGHGSSSFLKGLFKKRQTDQEDYDE